MTAPYRDHAPRWGVVHWEAALAGAAVVALYFLVNVTGSLLVGAFADDGVYAILGKAIASGEGYRSLHLTGAPEQVRFPPAFPLVLAALWRIGGTIDAVQAMIVPLHSAVIGITVAVLWYVARAQLGAPRVLAGALVVAPFALDAAITYNSIAIAEPWYLLASSLAIVTWYRMHHAGGHDRRWAVGLGLLVAAAILFRTQAVALLPALAVGLWRRGTPTRGRLLVLGVACAPPFGWAAWNSMVSAGGVTASASDETTYLQWLGGSASPRALLAVPVDNVSDYVSTLGPYLSSAGGSAIAALLLLSLAAAAAAAVRRAPVPAVFALTTMALLLVWPSSQDRLLLSWLPFAGLAVCGAFAPALQGLPLRARQAVSVVFAVAAGLVMVRQLDVRREALGAMSGRERTYFTPLRVFINNSAHIAQVSRWLRQHAGESDRTLVDGAAGVFLYSGRTANPLAPSVSRLAPPLSSLPAGRYLARRISGDSATLLISGPSADIAREVTALNEACPGTLVPGQPPMPDPVAVLRVQRRDSCVGALAAGTP